jgi:hypothetical protein
MSPIWFETMTTHYEKLLLANLSEVYRGSKSDLHARLPARKEGSTYHFRAFGEDCCVTPESVDFSGTPDTGPKGLLVSLYARHVGLEPIRMAPFKAFRDLPNSMPYQGAFSANCERRLIPHVSRIRVLSEQIKAAFEGDDGAPSLGGDFSLLLFPLPKIALTYVFYLPDEEFPASVTCLFSANAISFMPLDGLADVGEYTSRRLAEMASGSG